MLVSSFWSQRRHVRTAMLLSLAAPSWAGEVFGIWKLNPARSTLAGNDKSVTLRIEPHGSGEVLTWDTVASDGRASTSSTILYFDGKARDFQDSACSGTQSSRRLDGGIDRDPAQVQERRANPAGAPRRDAGSTDSRNH